MKEKITDEKLQAQLDRMKLKRQVPQDYTIADVRSIISYVKMKRGYGKA